MTRSGGIGYGLMLVIITIIAVVAVVWLADPGLMFPPVRDHVCRTNP